MFCGQCGSSLGAGARFCSACGAPALAAPATVTDGSAGHGHALYGPVTRLRRPRANRIIAGVCAGIADHYRLELVWVRVAAVLLAIFSSGAGIVAYIVFWIVMPEQPLSLPASIARSAPPI